MYEPRVLCPMCGHNKFRKVKTSDVIYYFGDGTKMYRTELECRRCRYQW